jgi:hypothetical protein
MPPARTAILDGFDRLWLNGEDRRQLWSERKRRLQTLIEKLPPAATCVIN